jgi:dihydrolipoamide dehydrogenase
LRSAEIYHYATHAEAYGLKIEGKVTFDPAAVVKRSRGVSAQLNGGVGFLLKKNKVESFFGHGSIKGAGKVDVKADDGKVTTLETKNIVIATGSDIATPPGVDVPFDEKTIVSSTGALTLDKVPGKLIVIGAGVIGLELGSVWKRLGAEVVVVEYHDRILPGMDNEVAKQFQRILEKQGFAFHLSSKVTKVEKTAKGGSVTFSPVAGGDAVTLAGDVVLVATGRRPYTDGLGLEESGVAMERGRVVIDNHFATNVPGVYAIGDVVRGPMLAHKAEDEGVAVAEILAGQHGHVNYDVIPGVVYTMPEIAAIGKTEEELKAAGVAYKSGKFPFTANGRARAMRHTEGFVKVLADATTDRVLGVHIIGISAGELIAECAVLMEFGGSSEDLARTCHAHPTISEAVKEAAMAVEKRQIHM